ncbi:MAG: N-acetylmuramoyl-L-alanine amidase [Fluviibacter sp.]
MNTWIRFCAVLVASLAVLVSGCASFQPDTTLPAMVVASPNHDARQATMVVIHYTTNDDTADSLQTLTSPLRKVSAHYLIDRQGGLYQLVPENRRAWHAGQAYWAGVTDINSVSLGIEIDNAGNAPFDEAQIATLLNLLSDIQTRHKIRAANVVGHADVSPGRKVDPGPYFPWRRLAQAGFGLWCDQPIPDPDVTGDVSALLVQLGYDPRLPDSSRAAFREHYLAKGDGTNVQDETLERAMARCLLEQRNQVGPGGMPARLGAQ